MENWLFPVLMIPACAMLLTALSPRLITAIADRHHALHGQCQACAAHESGFRLRIQLLAGATCLLVFSCFAFALSGLLGGASTLLVSVPASIPVGFLLIGVVLLLMGCGCFAAESLLLLVSVSMAATPLDSAHDQKGTETSPLHEQSSARTSPHDIPGTRNGC
jgi:hypothetical protein